MNTRFFGGMDLHGNEGCFTLFDKRRNTFVVMAKTPFAIRFWLFVCKKMGIRVLAEVNEQRPHFVEL